MASGTLGPGLKHLSDLFSGGTTVGLGDAELLRRYAASRDGSAFEALVARHGPMVAATCRAVLRDHHDVEDVFQATFLVLARKAASIRAGDALGGWLHRVAYRAAVHRSLEVRRMRARELEISAMEIPDPSPPELDFEVRSILHEEIDRLPETERLPVVLCDLEGLTYEEAADRLRSTRPAVYHRLARGRERLRDRLIRRGVTAGAVAFAMESARLSATAAVPPAWSLGAVASATGGAIPAGVAALTHSMLRSLPMTRVQILTVAAVLALGSLTAAGLVARGAAGDAAPAPGPSASAIPPAPTEEPRPAAKPGPQPGTLAVEVRDLRTDAPMPGVQIKCTAWHGSYDRSSAKTDASGVARFPMPADVQSIDLVASREGFVRELIRWSRDAKAPGVPERFLFQMEKATTVRGRVVDPEGKPVAGATVVIEAKKGYPRSPQRACFSYESTRADAGGRWSFTGVPEEPDSVELAAYDYLRLGEWPYNTAFQLEAFRPLSAIRDGSATLRVLARGTLIEGSVIAPDGRGVGGAEVSIGNDHRYGNSIAPLKTDDRGRFRLGMTPGTVTSLMARADGFGPVLQTIRVGHEASRVAIRLQPPHVLSGRVVDPDGKPIAEADVRVTSWRGARCLEQLMKTGSDGRFTWNEAPGEEVQILASAVGYNTNEGVSIRPGHPQDIVLKRPATMKGTVVDAATGQPIPRFSLGIGTIRSAGGRLIWQRGESDADVRKSAGSFEYQIGGGSHQYVLRIFADGYLPADSERFPGDGPPRSFAFRLVRAEPTAGTVRNPDGSPAVGAIVSLVPAEQADTIDYLTIRNGEIHKTARWPAEQSKVGPDGRFSLPPQRGNFALVVLSDAGYAIVHSRDLPGDRTLRIRPWARVSGTVRIHGVPYTNMWFSSFDGNDPRQVIGEPRIEIRNEVKTDAQGHFEMPRVMAGRLTLGRMIPNGAERRGWRLAMATLDVESGSARVLRIGDSGRHLTGRLAIPPSPGGWMVRVASIEQRAPKGRPAPVGVEALEDGRLRVQDLPPGDYALKIAIHEPPPEDACGWGRLIAEYRHEFSVPGAANGPPIDLGTLPPIELGGRSLEVGDVAPDFSCKALDGRDLKLADFQGRFLLLDFWATWCAPCVAEMPNLAAVQKAFGSDPRFATVSLSLDDSPAEAQAFVTSQKLAWRQGHIGPDSPVAAAYGATAIPATFLIGPDGTILATGLRGEGLKKAIAEVLARRP